MNFNLIFINNFWKLKKKYIYKNWIKEKIKNFNKSKINKISSIINIKIKKFKNLIIKIIKK